MFVTSRRIISILTIHKNVKIKQLKHNNIIQEIIKYSIIKEIICLYRKNMHFITTFCTLNKNDKNKNFICHCHKKELGENKYEIFDE